MTYEMMREAHPVNLTWLPSRGVPYPKNIEILVSPITIKERKLLDGASSSQYYKYLLKGIQVSGELDKHDLLFADVQFLDLVRRIYTFESNKEIYVTDYPCIHCGAPNIKPKFKCTDIEFEDIKPEVFGSEKTYTDNETKEEFTQFVKGKEYTFSDGMTVVVYPLTVGEYIDMATRYLSNISDDKVSETVADLYVAEFTYLIKSIVGKEFPNDEARRNYIENYVEWLFLDEDQQVLDTIEADCTSAMKPIKHKCPKCGETLEVYVTPSMRFHK